MGASEDFVSPETRDEVASYLALTATFMPTQLLKSVLASVPALQSLDFATSLCFAPLHQMKKMIHRRFAVEQLAAGIVKLAQGSQRGAAGSHQGIAKANDALERAAAHLVYACSVLRTAQQAQAFLLCSESLRLTQELNKLGVRTSYDFGYACLTCTGLLEGLHEDYTGPRKVLICYACAQLCHSKHRLLPVGYMSSATWPGCQCHVVQGFQVAMMQTADSVDASLPAETTFHTCRARHAPASDDSLARNELSQPQLVHSQTSQQRGRLEKARAG